MLVKREIEERIKLEEKNNKKRCPISILEEIISKNGKKISLCPQQGPGCSYEYSLKCPLFPKFLEKYLLCIPYQPKDFCPVMVLNGYSLTSPVCKCDVPELQKNVFPCWFCKASWDDVEKKTRIEAVCVACLCKNASM